MNKLAPSILAADFAALGEEVKRVENDAMSFEPREEYMFQVYQTVSENVLGDYTQSVITNSWVYGMTQESLVVFPDELFEVYHQEMKENQKMF